MSAFEQAWAILLKAVKDDEEDLLDAFSSYDRTKPAAQEAVDSMVDEEGNLLDAFSAGGSSPPKQPVQQMRGGANLSDWADPDELRLGIVGHHAFGSVIDDWETFDDKIQEWIDIHGGLPDAVVHNGRGSLGDMIGQWAKDNGVPAHVHKPDFKGEGRYEAGPASTTAVVHNATHVLGFPSSSTDASYQGALEAQASGKPTHTYDVDQLADSALRDWTKRSGKGKVAVRSKGHWSNRRAEDDKGYELGAMPGFSDAARRMYGKQYGQGRMTTQSAKERNVAAIEGGKRGVRGSSSVEGLPMHQPLKRRATRHLPQKTDAEKLAETLREEAGESGSMFRIDDMTAFSPDAMEQQEGLLDQHARQQRPRVIADEEEGAAPKPVKRTRPAQPRKPRLSRSGETEDEDEDETPTKQSSLDDWLDDTKKGNLNPIDAAWAVLKGW